MKRGFMMRLDRPHPHDDNPAHVYFDHGKAGASIQMSIWEHSVGAGISKGQAKDLYLALKEWVDEKPPGPELDEEGNPIITNGMEWIR